MSNLIKLRLSLSGSSLSAQKAANGILTAGVLALSHRGIPMTDRSVQHLARLVRIHSLAAMANDRDDGICEFLIVPAGRPDPPSCDRDLCCVRAARQPHGEH